MAVTEQIDLGEGVEVLSPDNSTVALLNKSEIDQQITTAKKYPRKLSVFTRECEEMATLNERVAGECIYALPRDGKTIEGPSARLAEIVASAWGNCRAGARVVAEDAEFITAQGAFYDLERNVAIAYEVRRRITDKYGKRFKADMIAVTANAACSIALRNAVFKGIPKAFWLGSYEAARKAAVGDVKTIANKRADMLAYYQKMGVTEQMIFDLLNLNGIEDIGADELLALRGLATALKDGDTTIQEAFAPKGQQSNGGAAANEATRNLASKYANKDAKNTTPGSAGASSTPVTAGAAQQSSASEGAAPLSSSQEMLLDPPEASANSASPAGASEFSPFEEPDGDQHSDAPTSPAGRRRGH